MRLNNEVEATCGVTNLTTHPEDNILSLEFHRGLEYHLPGASFYEGSGNDIAVIPANRLATSRGNVLDEEISDPATFFGIFSEQKLADL